MAVIDPEAAVGLCLTCRHVQVVRTRTDQRYYRCERSTTDARYPKYPRLPVWSCEGHEPGGPPASDESSRAARRTDRDPQKAVGGRVPAR